MPAETLGIPGKTVGQWLYVHRDQIGGLDSVNAAAIAEAEEIAGATAWTVAKLVPESPGPVSLLTYQDFDEPFPALLESVTVDRRTGQARRRSYRARSNPPILHRKELLLDAGDPRRASFAALTSALEARGLFDAARFIGTREAWEGRLAEAGIRIEDHRVCDLAGRAVTPPFAVQRHLAAIERQGLSTPIRALLRFGLIDEGTSVFDYGCGRGSDVEGLNAAGIDARGWDPHFAPDEPRTPADVVNLGFVLNVVEDPAERVMALRDAFGLAQTCLVVAVITGTSARLHLSRPYADGFITSRGTFQKLYRTDELRDLLETTLKREAFPVGPGVFFVFKDDGAEQAFLARRQRAARPVSAVEVRAERGQTLAALGPDLERLWSLILEHGRMLARDELDPDLVERLVAGAGSLKGAFAVAHSAFDPMALEQARAGRRDDLLVTFALNVFNRRTRYRALPDGLQRDVKALFGAYAAASEEARKLLFSLGRPGVLADACHGASQAGVGWLEDDGALWIDARLLDRLPPALRCFAGCAGRYYGDLGMAQVLKIHAASGKLSGLIYEDYDISPLPRLTVRIKIDLRAQRIFEWDHRAQDQRLLLKSRLMAADQIGYVRQATFDAALTEVGVDTLGQWATGEDLTALLARAGLVLDRFDLRPASEFRRRTPTDRIGPAA